MPITEAQRRILTPRVDAQTTVPDIPSSFGAQIAGTISEVTGDLAQRSFDRDQRIARERAKQEAELKKIRSQRETAVRKVKENEALLDLDANLEEIQGQFRNEHASNPMDTREQIRERMLSHIDDFAETIEDEQVRTAYRAKALNQVRGRLKQHESWEVTQSVEIAQASADRQGDLLAQQAFEAGKLGNEVRFSGLLDQVPNITQSLKTAGAIEDIGKISAIHQENIAAGYLYGLIETNPLRAKRDIEAGRFSKVLSPKRSRELTKDARQAADNLQKKLELDHLTHLMNQAPDRLGRAVRGEMTLPEIDTIIREEGKSTFNEKLREIVLKKHTFSAITDAQKGVQLVDDFDLLLDRIDEDADLPKGVKRLDGIEAVRELMQFNEKLMDMLNNGEISVKDYENTFLNKMIVPFTNEANQITGRRGIFEFVGDMFTSSLDPMKKGFREINQWIEDSDQKGNARLKMKMVKSFLDSFDRMTERRKQGEKIGIDDVIKETIQNGQRILNPTQLEIGEVFYRNGMTLKVVGIDADGMEIVEIVP